MSVSACVCIPPRCPSSVLASSGLSLSLVCIVGLSYIQTLRGYLVMGILYMVVSLFVHLYMFVTSCTQYKHEAQSLVIHLWSQHPENLTCITFSFVSRLVISLASRPPWNTLRDSYTCRFLLSLSPSLLCHPQVPVQFASRVWDSSGSHTYLCSMFLSTHYQSHLSFTSRSQSLFSQFDS